MDVQRLWVPVAVGVVVGLAFGTWMFVTRHNATPYVVEGWAMPNGTGTAISLHTGDGSGAGDGYVIAGAQWSGPDRTRHDGADGPTCVGTDTTIRTYVRLGVVDVKDDFSARSQVVWLRCLAASGP